VGRGATTAATTSRRRREDIEAKHEQRQTAKRPTTTRTHQATTGPHARRIDSRGAECTRHTKSRVSGVGRDTLYSYAMASLGFVRGPRRYGWVMLVALAALLGVVTRAPTALAANTALFCPSSPCAAGYFQGADPDIPCSQCPAGASSVEARRREEARRCEAISRARVDHSTARSRPLTRTHSYACRICALRFFLRCMQMCGRVHGAARRVCRRHVRHRRQQRLLELSRRQQLPIRGAGADALRRRHIQCIERRRMHAMRAGHILRCECECVHRVSGRLPV
jgi:hypothetical protein